MSESGPRTVVSMGVHRRGRARGVGLVMAIGIAAATCGGPSLPPIASAEAAAAFEACRELGWEEKQGCYEARLLDELGAGGAGAALEMLESLAAADREAQAQAHVLTHAIGINAYAPGETFTDAFEECTEVFQSGCYHGVVQAYFIAMGEPNAEMVAGLCAPYEADPADRWLLFQCLHGLGHGLTMYYGHHLLMALEGCDLLTTGWNRNSCYGGAFMENVVNAIAPHHPAAELVSDGTAAEGVPGETGEASDHGAGAHVHGAMAMADGVEPFEPLRADDPHYPCSILDEKYLTSCYQMQTSAMLWHNDGDIADAAAACVDAPDAWRNHCFVSLGRDISGRTLQDEDDARRECRKSPEEYREWCYVGAVRNFVDVTATTDAGFSFCRGLEDSAKPRCHEAMGEAVYSLYADEAARRDACEASETEELALACRRGALVTD
ncbi:MAG: hypothetical protein OXN85_05300 [Gemmatimonadetes bacterium]|nr:hypothetical protein [Candidatus Palauibacter australiensis]